MRITVELNQMQLKVFLQVINTFLEKPYTHDICGLLKGIIMHTSPSEEEAKS